MSAAQGEAVSIVFNDALSTGAPVPMILKDSQAKTRTLQPYEQLIVDDLAYNVGSDGGGGLAIIVYAGPNADDQPGNITIGIFGSSYLDSNGNSTPFGLINESFKHEGLALPRGRVPNVYAGGVITGTLSFSGSGRIITASQKAGRQPWQDRLNP